MEIRERFNMMVKLYSERLYWHIRSIVSDHEDADDILQNTFLKAWKNLPQFRDESNELTWLWRIATNECFSFLRRKRMVSLFSLDSVEASMIRSLESDSALQADKMESALARALVRLPDKQRAVFCMRYYEDLTFKEISEITGTSEGALKASYHIAREKIEKEIKLSE